MFAVIKTGGKQYKVETGKKIKVEKLELAEGAKMSFDEVLLVADDKKVAIGQPLVASAKVEATVLSHGKAKKVQLIKYKAKKRYSVKKGHRQLFTELEITKVVA